MPCEGIKPDPNKYEIIQKYSIPTNADDIRRFLAFSDYYRDLHKILPK